jgi:plastocyanin
MKRFAQILAFSTMGIYFSSAAMMAEEEAQIVEFHIVNGTGSAAWNAPMTMIHAIVGDTIRFYNDDTVNHQLHTNGAPCAHGPTIRPGTSWDCVVSRPYDANRSGALYDHNYGPRAEVWINATAQY